MVVKNKSMWWNLTFPFAHANATLVGDTLYVPKGYKPTRDVLKHEGVHSEQMKRYGIFTFYFKYLFCLPFFFNQFRYECEYEAYTKGSGLSHKDAISTIRGRTYGWLQNEVK